MSSAESGVRAAVVGTVWALHPCVRGVGVARTRSGRLRPTIVRWVDDRPWWALGWEMFRQYPLPFVREYGRGVQ